MRWRRGPLLWQVGPAGGAVQQARVASAPTRLEEWLSRVRSQSVEPLPREDKRRLPVSLWGGAISPSAR